MFTQDTSAQLIAPTFGFGLDLLRYQYKKDPKKDTVLVSPATASLALGMTMNGTRGKTWDEMRDALRLPNFDDKATINAHYRGLVAALSKEATGVDLAVAQALLGRKDFIFRPEFIAANTSAFKARVRNLDFSNPEYVLNSEDEDADGVKIGLNPWCKQQTRGFIPDILKELSPDALMLLASALAFQGDWTYQFDYDATNEDGDFNTPAGIVKRAIMSREGMFNYTDYTDDLVELVMLPFAEAKRLNLCVLLPKEGVSIDDVLENLTDEKFWQWTQYASYDERPGQLYFPRHEQDDDILLNEALQANGMELAFGGGDFGDLADGDIKISRVKQKNFARYHELGGEGGSVTVVETVLESLAPQPFEMKVDRPFITVLADVSSGATIFQSVVNNPKPAPKPARK